MRSPKTWFLLYEEIFVYLFISPPTPHNSRINFAQNKSPSVHLSAPSPQSYVRYSCVRVNSGAPQEGGLVSNVQLVLPTPMSSALVANLCLMKQQWASVSILSLICSESASAFSSSFCQWIFIVTHTILQHLQTHGHISEFTRSRFASRYTHYKKTWVGSPCPLYP